MDNESKYFLKIGGYRQSRLKLAGYKHDPSIPLKNFIHWYVAIGYDRYDTLYLNNRLQCKKGRLRSLGDIYRICAFYYPGCTFVQVRMLLLKLETQGHFCPDIEKRVFFIHQFCDQIGFGRVDEFGFPILYYRKSKKIYCTMNPDKHRSVNIAYAKSTGLYYGGNYGHGK